VLVSECGFTRVQAVVYTQHEFSATQSPCWPMPARPKLAAWKAENRVRFLESGG